LGSFFYVSLHSYFNDMALTLQIREITGLQKMLAQLPLIQCLNPKMTQARYQQLLEQMLLNQYHMVGVFEQEVCLGLSGYWLGTKLYSGRYLEVDNFVVDETHRSKGVGKLLLDWLTAHAQANHCETMMLDAYVVNHAAHKFYLREGFVIKGFHFLKSLS
jgi:GNAT superfamily N-acetyltransferase